ncbi:MAG: PilZ domain-containing protein [Desulfobacteraceae bacterium]
MKFIGSRLKNKRKHDRKLCSTMAQLVIQNNEHTCRIENISKGGALLSIGVHFPLKIGELVEIQIPFSDGKRYVKKTAKVKRFNDKNIAIKFLW